MNGYFSRLARSTGMRVGEGGLSAPRMPVSYDAPASPQPLEVAETRIAPTADEGGEPDRHASDPLRGATDAAHLPPGEEYVMGIRETGSLPHDAADRQGSPGRGDESFPAVIRIDEERSRERSISASEKTGAAGPDPMSAAGDASREEGGTPMEEFVVRMIEGNLGRTDSSGDGRSRIDGAARSLLRDVIGWIGSPPDTADGLTAGPLEDMVIREPGERTDDAAAVDGFSMKDGAGRPAHRHDPFDVIDRMEMERLPERRDPHAPPASEPGISDFTLSIGSIRIVIEEPSPQGTVPSPPQRPEAGAGEKRSEPSRLSRHYI